MASLKLQKKSPYPFQEGGRLGQAIYRFTHTV